MELRPYEIALEYNLSLVEHNSKPLILEIQVKSRHLTLNFYDYK